MSRMFYVLAFFLGMATVAWMALDFMQTNPLAFGVTLVIGLVFIIGTLELLQTGRLMAQLQRALDRLNRPVERLDEWLAELPEAVQTGVRARVAGGRHAVLEPVLTPYLAGLLVMLGLLGTFAGMVFALKGSVVALEGSADLASIRAGLAAPIKGLGLAFGTSVAGVAASAMLGLMAALSRRERMLVIRQLDQQIATNLREHNGSYQREAMLQVWQQQAQSIPQVGEQVAAMVDRFEAVTERLTQALLNEQGQFHESVKTSYEALALKVSDTLSQSLAQGSREAGEQIKPVLQDTLHQIQQQAEQTYRRLEQGIEQQLGQVSKTLGADVKQMQLAWQEGVTRQQQGQQTLVEQITERFDQFNQALADTTQQWLEEFERKADGYLQHLNEFDQDRAAHWQQAFGVIRDETAQQLGQIGQQQQAQFTTLSDQFVATTAELSRQLQQSGELSLQQQDKLSEMIEGTASTLDATMRQLLNAVLAEFGQLTASSEQLLEARARNEAVWLEQQQNGTKHLVAEITAQLDRLSEIEQHRTEQVMAEFVQLESVVTEHLVRLGQGLEEPITRLVHTASETPKAAAEVIVKLREALSAALERDNQQLQERTALMAQLETVASDLAEASQSQQQSVSRLVDSTTQTLQQVCEHFNGQVEAGLSQLTEVADQYRAGAVDVASLGETFHHAVELYSQTNDRLLEKLAALEEAIGQSSARHDEQLAYYLEQAREIIDYSMMSQQDVLEKIRQLQTPGQDLHSEVEAVEEEEPC